MRTLSLVVALVLASSATNAQTSSRHSAMHQQGHDGLKAPGQAAFGAITEVVTRLEADPKTDWTKVDIARLRDHLVDMDEVFMRAQSQLADTSSGVRITVTGTGTTLAAIQRMVPAHARMMDGQRGWQSRTQQVDNGIQWQIDTPSQEERIKIRALGFFGLLTLGGHHAPHHWAMARGASLHDHEH
jgi:hypothetical protein